MLFKSISHISRHASLAKSFWTSSSNPSSQPSFFVSTSQLARHQSQVAIRQPSGFGSNSSEQQGQRNAYTSACAGLSSANTFSTLSPLVSLDDDKQRELFLVSDVSGVHHDLLLQSRSKHKTTRPSIRKFSVTSIDQSQLKSGSDDAPESQKDSTKPEVGSVVEPETQKQHQQLAIEDSEEQLESKNARTPVQEDPELAKAQSLFSEGKYGQVLDLFDSVQETSKTPSLGIYNAALSSILKICKNKHQHDPSPLLDVYGQMLDNQVKPNVQTYMTVISGLLDAAEHQQPQKSDEFLFSTRGVLPSVDTQIERMENASQFITLALQIFEASNSAVWQVYPKQFIVRLLNVCISQQIDKIATVVESFEQCGFELTSDIAEILIKAHGKVGSMGEALDVHSKCIDKTDAANAALISAYFNNLDSAQAVKFFEQLMDNEEQFTKSLSAVVIGFAQNGDTSTAWNWIKQAELDDSIPAIPSATLVETFKHICDHGDMATGNELFDYVASMEGFNSHIMRSKYANLCLNHGGDVHKAIKECQLRNGVWDPATIVQIVKYLAQEDIALACQVFTAQSHRLKQYLTDNSPEYMYLGEEALTGVIEILKPLGLHTALTVASSAFMNSKLLTSKGSDIFEAVWNSAEEYKQSKMFSRLITLDIVVLHNMWIKSVGSGAPEFLSKFKDAYEHYVSELILQGSPIEESFAQEVSECLEKLGLGTEKWKKFCSGEVVAPAVPEIEFNTEESNKCIGYCQVKNGTFAAFDIFESTLIRGELIAPEAIYALLDSTGNFKLELLSKTYKLLLDYMPQPSTSGHAWDIWVNIHRRMVQHCADKDYQLAQTAYLNLKNMGSCPDATGYGHLISHAPVSSSRDDASDAVQLFNESRLYNVVPTTFLYNVLLSKLSKARRLREAVSYFNDMETTNTKKSSITYGTMISACCRAGDEQFAKQLFDEMEACPNYVARVAPFNIMLQFYVHSKRDRAAAQEMLQRMKDHKVEPSAHTYKLIIDMYSTIEPIDIEAADGVLLEIIEDEHAITTQHYAALLFARGVGLKDLDAAKKFYGKLIEKNRVHPDKLIFQALLESYVVNGRVEETGAVLQDMMRFGVDLNAYMANILIRGWAPVNLAKSVGLFDHILNRKIAEPSSFESIIRAFLFHGDVQSAMNVLETMKANRYPEPVTSKVEGLLSGNLSSSSILLDSIFRQDAHRLVM